MSGRKRNIIILDEEGMSSASKNPITAYFSPFGQGQRAKVSRPNQDSQQPIPRATQAPLIIDLTLDEDDGDDIPLAAQAAPQAAGAVHHAKSTRSAAGHTIEHTNLSQTMQFELLEAKQEVMEVAEGLVTTTESAGGRAGSSAGTAGAGPAHAACSGTTAANGPATGSATSDTVCTLPRARADPYEGLLVPSVDSECEQEDDDEEEEEDVGSAAEEFVMGEPYPSSDSSDAERERESDRDGYDSSAADGTRDKNSVAEGLPKRGARGKRAAVVAGQVAVAAAKPETTAPKPKKAGAATSKLVPAPPSAPDYDEKEEEEEAKKEWVKHPLDDWTPTRSRAEMGAAPVVEPHKVPVLRPPEDADDSSADSHDGDGDEEYCRNEYFHGVYSAALGVAVKGLRPTTWQPAPKKLSGAASKEEQQQLKSFKDAHAVLARTEHMFAKHLLDPASISLWQGHTRVQQEEERKYEKGASKDAKSDAAGIELMWEYENICNAFCLLNFFPDTEPHLETCAGTGTATVCSFPSLSSKIADKTRSTIRSFLIHDGKNIPIGDQAIAVSTLRSNLYHAMNARRHMGDAHGPPIYVLPSAAEMRKVVAQAIRGASIAEIVGPACTIISALKTLICHQAKPVASKCCRGGHPQYPRQVSMLRLQRELGLDFDWKYEPSFLEFAAVLDKSVFLLEHFHKDTPQSCRLPWGADILLGPAVALDFISTVLCRMRRHDSTTYAYDKSRVPHEHDMNRVPLLIKVLHRENVPSARVLRLLMFQTVRLVRLEQVLSRLGTKTDEKEKEEHAAFLRNISLVIGACTMLLIALDRYVSVHVQGKASLSTTIQARDDFYSSLLRDVKGILPADMLAVQQAVVRSPLVAAGFTKSATDIFSFRHEPLQHLLQMLTLRQDSAIGMISDMQREGLVKAMQYAHLSNQLPLQEFIRLQFANQRRNVLMNGEKQESNLHDKVLQTMTSAAEKVLQQLDAKGTGRLTPTVQAAAVTPDATTRNADPVEVLVRRMLLMSSMKSTR